MEQLACGHCGAQMHVERGGGAISLQLVEALGSIRIGAVQTAAELALVRLEKERNSASYEVKRLEREIEQESARLRKQDIMSEKAVASAREGAKTLEAEMKGGWGFAFITGGVLMVVCVCVFVFATWYFSFNGWISQMALLLALGWGAVHLMVSIMTIRKERLGDSLEEVNKQIARHLEAERAKSTLSHCRELLPDARASLTRIEEAIAYNKKIVSLNNTKTS